MPTHVHQQQRPSPTWVDPQPPVHRAVDVKISCQFMTSVLTVLQLSQSGPVQHTFIGLPECV